MPCKQALLFSSDAAQLIKNTAYLELLRRIFVKQGVESLELVDCRAAAAPASLPRDLLGFFRIVPLAELPLGGFERWDDTLLVLQNTEFIATNLEHAAHFYESYLNQTDGKQNQTDGKKNQNQTDGKKSCLGLSVRPTGAGQTQVFDEWARLLTPPFAAPSVTWADSYGYTGYFFCNKAYLEEWLQDSREPWNPQALPLLSTSTDAETVNATICLSGAYFNQADPRNKWPLATEAWELYLKRERRPCLFLDRDGIINVDTGYPHKVEELICIPEIIPLIQAAKKAGWWVVVLTNQAGIAHGYYDVAALHEVHGYLDRWLAAHGASPDAWYFSPYHHLGVLPPYNRASLERKPFPGMALQAMQRFPIAVEASLMVGDRDSDALLLPGLRYFLLAKERELNHPEARIFHCHSELVSAFASHLGSIDRKRKS